MLKTFIHTTPLTKFILIIDSLENRDVSLLDYIIKPHLNKQLKINYCVFEGVFRRTEEKYRSYSNITLRDFIACPQSEDKDDFHKLALTVIDNDIVIVDSVANSIFRYGLPNTYKIFNTLKNNKAVRQIISVLHKDLLEDLKADLYFTNLSTLAIKIQPKFMTDAQRLQYQYKKSGGRIISGIEEYHFEGEHLVTNKIANPDAIKILEKSLAKPTEINPEELSTFKISLNDEEKFARDRVVLPYLPNANEQNSTEGRIFYQFDEVDDWDEEDPDDDLDI